MTRTPKTRRTVRLRRIVAVSALAAGVAVTSIDGGADAARRTSSAAIADEAQRALDALDRWRSSENPADYVRFVQHRAQAATITAGELELDPAAMRSAWATAPAVNQHAVLAAMSQLGVPYRSIASEPGVGFDCSGLTSWAFASAGVEVPRVSGDQMGAADEVGRVAAQPGDLVYYPGHVGIFLGVGSYVHSPEPGSDVEAVHLPDRSLRFGDLT